MSGLNSLVKQFTADYLTIWWDTAIDFPDLVSKINNPHERLTRQKANEKELNQWFKDVIRDMKRMQNTGIEHLVLLEKFKISFRKLGTEYFALTSGTENLAILEDFYPVTDEFIREAKKFDFGVANEDIFQAVRNVWIMNSLQVLFGRTIEYSQSILAYSMLYPYTDNYLDDLRIPIEVKVGFNVRLKNYLDGIATEPLNEQERKIFDLIRKIEGQYPRLEYPVVYESLLAIHSAQRKSLLQQSFKSSPYEADILGISFEKGGCSVLADGYLVAGDLVPEAARIIFGMGVLLQLIDDLEDTQTDFRNGQMTIFSQTLTKWPLDKITNRLFRLIDRILDSSTYFTATPQARALQELTRKSCIQLVCTAIAGNEQFYTADYLSNLEAYTPFRLTFLRKLKPRLRRELAFLNKTGLHRRSFCNFGLRRFDGVK
jgi:hypothetical protein